MKTYASKIWLAELLYSIESKYTQCRSLNKFETVTQIANYYVVTKDKF